jgi:hypothetical protein
MPSRSSSTFWSLIDRWHVPDAQALELVSYEGKLPDTGKRPRFKLSPDQERIVSTLVEIDNALTTAGLDASWLNRDDSSTGRTPLDLMRAGAMDEVLHSLTQAAFRASLQPLPRTRKKKRSQPRRSTVAPTGITGICCMTTRQGGMSFGMSQTWPLADSPPTSTD